VPEEGCDAARAARTVARLLQPNAWEKRLRLSVNVESGLKRVAADPRLLRRVLLKLVGNAIKFTERGNIEVALDSMPRDYGAAHVRFTVTDTGPGIPHHLLANLFEPFTREDDSYARRYAGAGVGLSVAKRLVESIGGEIGVDSEPGKGARFWFTVPAIQAPAAESASEEDSVTPPNGLSILAFLPDDAMRTEVERLLAPFGNSITVAGTLAQAVTMAARGGFALIIAAAGSVDALAATPGQRTPILALTTAEERHPDGGDAVLRWPAGRNGLFAAIISITGDPSKATEGAGQEDGIEAVIDAKAISELEKSLGLKTLIDILQSYMHAAEELAGALSAASEKGDWGQAGRLAQDIAGAAGGLGLTAVTAAARSLAQAARDGAADIMLSAAADSALTEHTRVREALRRLYPDLSA
jgi:HPt (histidine-containing phosphotransfer) domain-containing protein